jgi:hypothetical protein
MRVDSKPKSESLPEHPADPSRYLGGTQRRVTSQSLGASRPPEGPSFQRLVSKSSGLSLVGRNKGHSRPIATFPPRSSSARIAAAYPSIDRPLWLLPSKETPCQANLPVATGPTSAQYTDKSKKRSRVSLRNSQYAGKTSKAAYPKVPPNALGKTCTPWRSNIPVTA